MLLVVLLPKPKGGFRPIVLMNSLFKLWSRARRPGVQGWWYDENDQPFLACGKGRSVEACVWRRSVRSEAGVAMGKSAATVLWDARKFYGNFILELLVQRGIRLGFPRAILLVCCYMYRAQRILRAGCFHILLGMQYEDSLQAVFGLRYV